MHMRTERSLLNKHTVLLPAILAGLMALSGFGCAKNTVTGQKLIIPEGTLYCEASGTLVKSGDTGVIDWSNTKDGYVMAMYAAPCSRTVKAQVKGPETTYTYTLTPGEWVSLPLTEGNGAYRVNLLENVEGNKYALTLSAGFDVTLSDPFAPFLRPNCYVDYQNAPLAVDAAARVTAGATTVLGKVAAVYTFVLDTLSYDRKLAEEVQPGYVPDLDRAITTGKGICFDYAALMAGMLRAVGVPTKLVVGYAGDAYHAWISVWSEELGWVEKVVYFDGVNWQRMDPTFADAGLGEERLRTYVGDGKNYVEKYIY